MTAQGYEAIGLIGAGFYLTSYFLLQIGMIRGETYTYTILNLIGASLVAVSLVTAFNSASLVIQVSWITISILGLVRMTYLRMRTRFSDEEAAFLATKLPHLPKPLARKLLDHGFWIDGPKGTVLTVQGDWVQHLIYLQTGLAEVSLNGKIVANCRPESFIGEMTCLTGEPATASVFITEDARYLCLDAAEIRKMVKKDPSLAQALELSFAQDIRGKLIATNNGLQAPT